MRLSPILLLMLASCGSSPAAVDSRALDRAPAQPDGRGEGVRLPDRTMGDRAAAVTYGELTDPARWQSFTLTAANPMARGYMGIGFDGRYAYFVPLLAGGLVARFDTTADFGQASSWSFFDLATVNANAKLYAGAAFDGRYLYLAPGPRFSPGAAPTPAARYDTTAAFTSASSWKLFATTSLNPDAHGFGGAVFDKRYVYFVPFTNGNFHGLVTRYDTKADFAAASSWAVFNVTSVNPLAAGFLGGVFDGRYLHLVPTLGVTARYDTTAPFGSASSWATFAPGSMNPGAHGFAGGAFDGRYLYLVPERDGAKGLVARYDTTASYASQTAWSFFDLAGLNAKAIGYASAAFDGRFLFLAPYTNAPGVYHGLIARLDTTAPFSAGSSWTIFDIASINPLGAGFAGAAFDGRHLYLGPMTQTGAVVRFDAKTPPSMPSCYNGSFF